MKADLLALAQPAASKAPQRRRGKALAIAALLVLLSGSLGAGYLATREKTAAASAPSSAVAPAPPVVKPLSATFRGRQYTFVAEPLPWAKANDHARAAGGRLAVVTDAEMNGFLTDTFARGSASGIHLGGHCWRPGGAWEWSTGQAWQWSGWEGTPPLFGALVLAADGRWEAVAFDEARPFVIEAGSGS